MEQSLSYTVLHFYETITKQLIRRLYVREAAKSGTKIGEQTYQLEHAISVVNITDTEKLMIK
jgi:hypothetical protein